jgi:hypothetical protein
MAPRARASATDGDRLRATGRGGRVVLVRVQVRRRGGRVVRRRGGDPVRHVLERPIRKGFHRPRSLSSE